jgi:hypothetical protein
VETLAETIGPGPEVGPVVNPAEAGGQLPFAMQTPTVGMPGAAADPVTVRVDELEQMVMALAQAHDELAQQVAALLGPQG